MPSQNLSIAQRTPALKTGGQYFGGLDYAKIFFAMAIVAWHTMLFGPAGMMGGNAASFTAGVVDVLYGNVLLAGVPVFFLVSLFLYLKNRSHKKDYFGKRIKTLTFLYCFWTLAVMVFLLNGVRLEYFTRPNYIITGGASHLYFLFSLLLLTLMAEGMLQLKKRLEDRMFYTVNNVMLAAAVAIMLFPGALAGLPVISGFGDLAMSFLSPLSYLAYPFLAISLDRYHEEGRLKVGRGTLVLAGAICLSAALEWVLIPSNVFLPGNGLLIPPYGRISLVLSSVLVVTLFLSREFHPPAIVKTLSGLTLGVYIIHYFLIRFFSGAFPELCTAIFSAGNIFLIRFLYFATILGISALLTYCIKKVGVV